jgi:NADH-quinone oxidoreductase subunit M
MGGVAFKAPVLATFFLIVMFATLAMPGSSNFVGEFLILLGTFDSHLAVAVIASIAVVGAAFYALRLFIAAMHNRVGGEVHSREIGAIEAIAIVPLIAIILVLAFYPQFGLNKSEGAAKVAIAPAALAGGGSVPYGLPGAQSTAAVHWKFPPLSQTAYSPSRSSKGVNAQ